MAKFDTQIQYLKYQVLKEVAKEAWDNTLLDNVLDIPKKIIPGKKPSMRCCVYKERAILGERVKLAMGGDRKNPNIIEVIEIACDECPIGGYEVTNSCRGCLAHRCHEACPRDAIYFDENHQAHINKEKCINCGQCAKVCPYSAIANRKRPCANACAVKAISANTADACKIDHNKCVNCGACMSSCPFGAIMDKSYILDMIDFIRKSENNTKYNVYALVAPAIADQFTNVKLGQVFSGLRAMGFKEAVEVALGADMVAESEATELIEKGFLLSSCCPAFVAYTKKNYPKLQPLISHNLSPMGVIGKYIKEKDPTCKTVFIGPCTAKKAEAQLPTISPYIDCVITYEELQALFDSKDIVLSEQPDEMLNQASYFGRIFAKSGGLAEAMEEGLKELGSDIELKPIVCNGIDECRLTLLKKNANKLDANFVEGMACLGGCIGGAGTITHRTTNPKNVDKYGHASTIPTIVDSVKAAKQ